MKRAKLTPDTSLLQGMAESVGVEPTSVVSLDTLAKCLPLLWLTLRGGVGGIRTHDLRLMRPARTARLLYHASVY